LFDVESEVGQGLWLWAADITEKLKTSKGRLKGDSFIGSLSSEA